MPLFRSHSAFWQIAATLAIGFAGWPAHAQTLGLAPTHEVSPWRVVGALVFCCALGGAGALALRYRLRRGSMPSQVARGVNWRTFVSNFAVRPKAIESEARRLRLVETVRLGFNVEVNLLDCDGKSLVVVTSPHGALVAHPDAAAKTGEAS